MKKIQDFLLQLGFSEIEASIYESLLDNGGGSVKEVADHAGINRVTAHYHIENLIKKGLLTETRSGARRVLIAEKPERLEYLIDQKVEAAVKLKEKFPDLVKTIKMVMPNTESDDVALKYYKGKVGVKQIYEEVLQAKEIRAYVTADVERLFPENPDLFTKTLNKRKDMQIWEILDQSQAHDNYVSGMDRNRYHYKFISKKLEITDYIIFDGKVAIIDIEDKNEDTLTGLLINNINFYKSSKTLFDFIWQVLN